MQNVNAKFRTLASRTYVKFQKMAELGQLAVKVFVDGIKSFLELQRCLLAYGIMRWVVIDIREQDRLREGRFDVFSGATISVATGTYLEQ